MSSLTPRIFCPLKACLGGFLQGGGASWAAPTFPLLLGLGMELWIGTEPSDITADEGRGRSLSGICSPLLAPIAWHSAWHTGCSSLCALCLSLLPSWSGLQSSRRFTVAFSSAAPGCYHQFTSHPCGLV